MNALAAYLRDAGLTQAELARRLGCSEAFVSYMVSGSRAPGRKLARRIAIATEGAVPMEAWDAQEAAE